jgi:hypothetical protein
MRAVEESDNVIASITPFLKKLLTVLLDARDMHEKAQAAQKKFAVENRPARVYKVGDMVLLKAQGSDVTCTG